MNTICILKILFYSLLKLQHVTWFYNKYTILEKYTKVTCKTNTYVWIVNEPPVFSKMSTTVSLTLTKGFTVFGFCY